MLLQNSPLTLIRCRSKTLAPIQLSLCALFFFKRNQDTAYVSFAQHITQ